MFSNFKLLKYKINLIQLHINSTRQHDITFLNQKPVKIKSPIHQKFAFFIFISVFIFMSLIFYFFPKKIKIFKTCENILPLKHTKIVSLNRSQNIFNLRGIN